MPTPLGEPDLMLVEALQLAPRAPWAVLGAAIGVDARTAARRWERLRAGGLAWLTAYVPPPTLTIGYLDLACRPDRIAALSAELCSWPPVFSVEHTTGRHQLFLGVDAVDLAALDTLVTSRIGALDGVLSLRLTVVSQVYREGGDWLARALTPDQRAQLPAPAPLPHPSTTTPWNRLDADLVRELTIEPRRSAAELAQRCGAGNATVRRRLQRILRHRELDFRCDIANALAGWPVTAMYRITVPADQLAESARALAALPETRLCSAVIGDHNLLLAAWLHGTGDCADFEARMRLAAPAVAVDERNLSLRIPKRMGRLLNREGRAVGQVPMAPAR
ncbi:Lrp/AsnC family transcriptional regulator [Crossiella sp. SN42]|uniref:Lrp/AsnC family transcriptional regulator n=1 Tax=Crossiella sp. SN42 TaxID=2944808 RepID=UPI00207C72DC|nr:Lrp/AsnC ligand binding domain-containing protein [Crossiella sp. SN42]MCO1574270.1 Lrp/AsnC family transcriptional regulator [Crossiella sp. SN42]